MNPSERVCSLSRTVKVIAERRAVNAKGTFVSSGASACIPMPRSSRVSFSLENNPDSPIKRSGTERSGEKRLCGIGTQAGRQAGRQTADTARRIQHLAYIFTYK
ncbi:uncharacterized protein LOC116841510 isoform X2 [Odontomachus brunneus]|uniref:uncharacterized protein LOC116841510 isoform X2 n=1 Tax=Odontomachus brunneus TaxID=486640 RepID=UPI0013F1B46C|nr:uncharacterized protein LOC116841510 isoform X2 [Odontomachus brunneus]